MLTEVTSRGFSNGVVYMFKTSKGYPIEVTDTYLPYYTKDCINSRTNKLINGIIGNRHNRWMIGVSCMSGCPCKCKFCSTGKISKYHKLTAKEIFEQVKFIVETNRNLGWTPDKAQEFKINYTRMGEPFLNIENVKKAIKMIDEYLPNVRVHHYISTIGIKDSDFSWIKDNITLQVSLNSLDENRRQELTDTNNLMRLEEIGNIRTQSSLRTTLNLPLLDISDFDINILKKYFHPDYFFIKLSPVNKNIISDENNLGEGIIKAVNVR